MTADPPFAFTAQPSGDGHFLHITPTGFLPPGRTFTLRVEGGWAADDRSGAVDDTIRFRTAPVSRRGPPLRRGDAFRLSRLAVPLPPILPSLNQIGFDSYEMAVGALACRARQRQGAAALGGQHEARARAIADRRGAFAFPLRAATATTRCCSPRAASASRSRSATCRCAASTCACRWAPTGAPAAPA